MTDGAPVEDLDTKSAHADPEYGIALCLSGGGFRAMVFHLGALWRLHEAKLLFKLKRISSVSGGSLTAATLGMNWAKLVAGGEGNSLSFKEHVVTPIRNLASRTIDVPATLLGALLPGTISERLISAYDKHLFQKKTLQDLPDSPRFVINATNVQSGALLRFMKPYMRDWRIGEMRNPTASLAFAVAASSAFPPFLSPAVLELKPSEFTPDTGFDLQTSAYTTDLVLTDGGVYDNLGLETIWKRYKTILVSDGGGNLNPEPDPKRDWARHTYRVLELIDNQNRALRKRLLIQSYRQSQRTGAYWGIRTDIQNYSLATALPCAHGKTLELANIPTRLKVLSDERQEQLINWGYAVCDAALRKHFDSALPAPTAFPYPMTKL